MGAVVPFRRKSVVRVDWPLAVIFNVFVLVLVIGAVAWGFRSK